MLLMAAEIGAMSCPMPPSNSALLSAPAPSVGAHCRCWNNYRNCCRYRCWSTLRLLSCYHVTDAAVPADWEGIWNANANANGNVNETAIVLPVDPDDVPEHRAGVSFPASGGGDDCMTTSTIHWHTIRSRCFR